jgi:hypothetical protein
MVRRTFLQGEAEEFVPANLGLMDGLVAYCRPDGMPLVGSTL